MQQGKDSFGGRIVTWFIYALIAAQVLSIFYIVIVSINS
jgi:hypothetical protein